LAGTTLALFAEEVYGDALQFVRYAAVAKQKGARVVVDCKPALHRLFSGLPFVDGVYDGEVEQLPYDHYAPLLSMPHLLGSELGIPELDAPGVTLPYLRVPSAPRPPELEQASGLRVGLIWAGDPTRSGDRQRSVPLSTLDVLADVPGVSWFGLQFGPAREQLHGPLRMRISDLGGYVSDFYDLAQLMQHMDVVLTVDTAAAHLAGGLGRPTWVLLDEQADWRWLLERSDTPLYPSMRLFRQERPGAWEPLLAKVAQELANVRPQVSSAAPQEVRPDE
jgi:hypothetical protein